MALLKPPEPTLFEPKDPTSTKTTRRQISATAQLLSLAQQHATRYSTPRNAANPYDGAHARGSSTTDADHDPQAGGAARSARTTVDPPSARLIVRTEPATLSYERRRIVPASHRRPPLREGATAVGPWQVERLRRGSLRTGVGPRQGRLLTRCHPRRRQRRSEECGA
jgi:hypothetical protein